MSGAPVVSVVVPAHDRPVALARCLASLARQTFPSDQFEIIVVDDGSQEPLEGRTSRPPGGAPVAFVRQANTGPSGARNRGVAEARGEFVAFIDDDCEADPEWLAEMVAVMRKNPGAGVGGVVVNALSRNPFAETSQILVSFLCEYYNAEPGRARFFTSNNLAFPREALRAMGGFDEEYVRAAAEDRELCDRWRAQGRPLRSEPRAVVRHSHDLTLRTFVWQHYNYGVGARQFRSALAARNGGRVRVESPAFYFGLLTAPLRRHGARGLVHATLLAIAQIGNAIGFFTPSTARRSPE